MKLLLRRLSHRIRTNPGFGGLPGAGRVMGARWAADRHRAGVADGMPVGRPIGKVVAMSTHRPPPSDPQVALFEATQPWRDKLAWFEARLVPDGAAEIAAVVWEAITNGQTDERALFLTASRRIATLRMRHRRRSPRMVSCDMSIEPVGDTSDVGDTVGLRIDLAALFDTVPPGNAAPWVESMMTGSQHPLSAAEYKAGRRWANRARHELAGAGYAA